MKLNIFYWNSSYLMLNIPVEVKMTILSKYIRLSSLLRQTWHTAELQFGYCNLRNSCAVRDSFWYEGFFVMSTWLKISFGIKYRFVHFSHLMALLQLKSAEHCNFLWTIKLQQRWMILCPLCIGKDLPSLIFRVWAGTQEISQ